MGRVLKAATYRGVRYALAPGLEEELSAWLWRRGTLGSELKKGSAGELVIEAFFPAALDPGPLPPALRAAGARSLGSELVPDADWLAPYRLAAQPFPVGRRLLVDPREPGAAPAAPAAPRMGGRRLLRIPARTAFGTGSHESTRLALELMERVDFGGRRVLDVGTGSGILALAALAFGARAACAFDNDVAAPLVARQNARLNGLRPAFFAGDLGTFAESAAGGFEVALVNVVPAQITPELPALARLLALGALGVFSGILAGQGRTFLAALRRVGLRRRATRRAGEWIAYLVAKENG